MARLEKWSLVGLDGAKPLAVRGEIHGDERFSDGTPITSSRLCNLDPAGHFACTKNHAYELGTLSDAFARWMAANGRSIADFAAALQGKGTTKTARLKVTPITTAPAPRSATVVIGEIRAIPSVATRLEPSAATRIAPSVATSMVPAVATSLVATPTLIVAAG
ncbi:MAG: hypothetical protein ABIR79_22735 [Candidatus Binatia bacterium]